MTDLIELTAQDVRALKHADDLCFDHHADGTGQIRAIIRAENSPTGFEQVHTITATMSRIESYGKSHDAYTGFESVNARYNAEISTIVRHLRVGASFSLHWVRDNSSPVLRDAGLVRDELRIFTQARNAKTGNTFHVRTFVGLDNTARMIKPAHI